MHKLSENVLEKTVNNEKILLNKKTGMYYGLDQVGSFVLEKLSQGANVSEVASAMTLEFDVTEAEAYKDIELLVTELTKNEIIS